MFSKDNREQLNKKMNSNRPRWGIRKLSVGVVSVLLGLCSMVSIGRAQTTRLGSSVESKSNDSSNDNKQSSTATLTSDSSNDTAVSNANSQTTEMLPKKNQQPAPKKTKRHKMVFRSPTIYTKKGVIPSLKAPSTIKMIAEQIDLPASSIQNIEWVAIPNVGQAGTVRGLVNVYYQDPNDPLKQQMVNDVPLSITVVTDADIYHPKGLVQQVYQYQDLPSASEFVDQTGLPLDTQYSFYGFASTKQNGLQPIAILVTYPDGSSEIINTYVNVVAIPQLNVVVMKRGERPSLNQSRIIDQAVDYYPQAWEQSNRSAGNKDAQPDRLRKMTLDWVQPPKIDTGGPTMGIFEAGYNGNVTQTFAIPVIVVVEPSAVFYGNNATNVFHSSVQNWHKTSGMEIQPNQVSGTIYDPEGGFFKQIDHFNLQGQLVASYVLTQHNDGEWWFENQLKDDEDNQELVSRPFPAQEIHTSWRSQGQLQASGPVTDFKKLDGSTGTTMAVNTNGTYNKALLMADGSSPNKVVLSIQKDCMAAHSLGMPEGGAIVAGVYANYYGAMGGRPIVVAKGDQQLAKLSKYRLNEFLHKYNIIDSHRLEDSAVPYTMEWADPAQVSHDMQHYGFYKEPVRLTFRDGNGQTTHLDVNVQLRIVTQEASVPIATNMQHRHQKIIESMDQDSNYHWGTAPSVAFHRAEFPFNFAALIGRQARRILVDLEDGSHEWLKGSFPILNTAATLNVATNQNGMGMPMANGIRLSNRQLLPQQVDYQVFTAQQGQQRMINLRMSDRLVSIVRHNQQLFVINRDQNGKAFAMSIYSPTEVEPLRSYWRQFNGTFVSNNRPLGMLDEVKRLVVDDPGMLNTDQLNSLIDVQQLGDVPYNAKISNVAINKRTGEVKGMVQLSVPSLDVTFNVPINATIMKRNLKDHPDIFNLTNLEKAGRLGKKMKASFDKDWMSKALREASERYDRFNKDNRPSAWV